MAAALLSACATPPPSPPPAAAPAPPPPARPARDDLYVVVPGPGGRVGSVRVTHGADEAVLDQAYAAARIREPGRLESGTLTEAEAREAFGPSLDAQPPPPVSFTLFFLEGRDELTPESRTDLDRVLAELATRPAPEIVVIGHTDAVGSAAFNDALSLQRAERVRAELARLGIPPERIAVAGRGKRELLVPTADGVPEPRNRRVEVTVR
jgi:outer membrane protein OmpA-like peptidoglycan-associated protein